jgi:hypothetical protein
MNLDEFTTLAEAQAYTITTHKMVSGDQMRIFMLLNGLYLYFRNHTEALQAAAFDNLQGAEYNFKSGHPSNVTALFDGMIIGEADSTIAAQLTSLKNDCVAFSNRESKPYEFVEQLEFNEAVAAKELVGEQLSTATTYLGGLPYIIKSGKELLITVTFDNEVPRDVSVEIFAELSKDGVTFTPETRPVSTNLRFSVGMKTLAFRVAKGFASRKLHFFGKANVKLPFTVDVTET